MQSIVYYIVVVATNDSYAKVDRNLQLFLPSSVKTQATHEQVDSLTQKLRQYYFNGGPVTEATKKGFVDVSHCIIVYSAFPQSLITYEDNLCTCTHAYTQAHAYTVVLSYDVFFIPSICRLNCPQNITTT